jgi:hypothetical protein
MKINLRLCKICNTPLKLNQKLFCSSECSHENQTKNTKPCLICGTLIKLRPYKGVERKYCSRKCYHASRNNKYESSTKDVRRCCKCKQYLQHDKFSGNITRVCTKCSSEISGRTINDKKIKAINELGGKCIICGYNKCNGAMDLHHSDINYKKHAWGKMRGRTLEVIKQWITDEKIVLLCANCHREIHFPNWR